MYYAAKCVFRVMVLSSIVYSCAVAEPSRAERKITVKTTKEDSTVGYAMAGGGFVLIGKMSRGNAVAVNTCEFPRNSGPLGLRLEVGVSFLVNEQKGSRYIIERVTDLDSLMYTEHFLKPKDGETPIPLNSIAIPLKIEGLEVYVIPFRRAGEGVDSILVAISDDKQKIEEYLQFLPRTDGRVKGAFAPVYTPNSPVGCSVNEQIKSVIRSGTIKMGDRSER
jgi:hypothetical protein